MIGIDIGTKSIKIVELTKSGGGFSLNASGIVGFTGMPVDKLVDDREFTALSQVLKKLCKEAAVSSKEVAISIPEQLVFTRTVKFPLLTDDEIESAVKWEAEQYIPIPVAEAIIQHSILERREKVSPPEVIVLLVAAPRSVVEKYTKVVTLAGLTPVAVETELIALTRSLAPLDATVLIIDLGASSTDIAIARHGLLSFSRSVPIAGEAFTRGISQGLGITPVQAEEYKKAYGLGAGNLEGKIKGALSPILSMVTDEIKKAIHYYQTEEKGEAPGAIIVSGGTAGMQELPGMLTNLLGLEVLIGNPFSKVAIDPDIAKKLVPYAPLYAVSVGLALREGS